MVNSYVERVISSVTSRLRLCVQDTHLEWDESIDTIMMAYRSNPHSSTGFTFKYGDAGSRDTSPFCAIPSVGISTCN